MTGSAFRVSGSTGPAPITSWFGAVPDRLQMLTPMHWQLTQSQGLLVTEGLAGNYANLWVPFNTQYIGGPNQQTLTFGGFTTAPDGTANTAQKLVEDSSNNQHYVSAGFRSAGNPPNIRLAGFFKNAGRRIILAITNGQFNNATIGDSGVKAIFDLAGGQVAVAATAFGPDGGYVALGQGMIPYPNGFYLCFIDVLPFQNRISSTSLDRRCAIYLDNGTGTNAESSTYTGDGVSGTFGWKTNCMPIRAYGIGRTTYFEDFTSGTSTFDLSDTRAAGFSWYLHNQWPRLGVDGGGNIFPQPRTLAAAISVAGSVLTIDANAHPNSSNYAQVQSAAYTTDITPANPFVGFGHTLPALIEYRMNWNDLFTPNGVGSVWSASIPSVLQVTGIEGSERDYMEWGAANEIVNPAFIQIFYAAEGILKNFGSVQQSSIGCTTWLSTKTYPPGTVVSSGGVFYTSIASGNVNHVPPNASFWSVTADQNHTIVDFTAFHVFACLIFPATKSDVGFQMAFFDGLYAGTPLLGDAYIDYQPGAALAQGDGQLYPIFVLCPNPNILNVDYIKLTQ